jgi:Excalibur calcium-binding domain
VTPSAGDQGLARRRRSGRCPDRGEYLIRPRPAALQELPNLNKRYPHGIGRFGARDHTAGTPVTNFRRSNRLYRLAMSNNRGLDRDKDGIACEKA